MIKFVIAIAIVATVESQSVQTPAWQVKIGELHNGTFKHQCRGAIISERWILTSTSCLVDKDGQWENPFVETLGNESPLNYYRFKNIRVPGEFSFKRRVLKGPKPYSLHTSTDIELPVSDITLVQVDEPIKFHAKCKSIPIYDKDAKTLEGKTAVVGGWVLHQPTEVPTEVSTVLINTEERCKNYTIDYFLLPVDISRQICTDDSNNESSCSEFKGAPLVFNGSLVGIASWHLGNHQPIFYTEVAKYKSWIEENIAQIDAPKP